MINQITTPFEFLGAPDGRTFAPTILEFCSKRCSFLCYSNQHKGFKCIDVATGRIYISRDVIFYETIFPFSELHPNAGARLRSEILHLPSHLHNSSRDGTIPDHVNDTQTDATNRGWSSAESSVQNDVQNSPNRHYFKPGSPGVSP